MDDNRAITSGTNLSRPILPIDTLLINPEIRQILRPVLCPFIRQNELGIIKLPPHIFANCRLSCVPQTVAFDTQSKKMLLWSYGYRSLLIMTLFPNANHSTVRITPMNISTLNPNILNLCYRLSHHYRLLNNYWLRNNNWRGSDNNRIRL